MAYTAQRTDTAGPPRQAWVDIAKGISIMAVVVGNVGNGRTQMQLPVHRPLIMVEMRSMVWTDAVSTECRKGVCISATGENWWYLNKSAESL